MGPQLEVPHMLTISNMGAKVPSFEPHEIIKVTSWLFNDKISTRLVFKPNLSTQVPTLNSKKYSHICRHRCHSEDPVWNRLRASPTHSLYQLPASLFAGSPEKCSEEVAGGRASPLPGKSSRHTMFSATQADKSDRWSPGVGLVRVAGRQSLLANSKNLPRAGVV